jgi:hypothetical protein
MVVGSPFETVVGGATTEAVVENVTIFDGVCVFVKGFAVVIKGFAVVVKGFAVVVKGFAVVVKGFAVVVKGFAVVVKGFDVVDFPATVPGFVVVLTERPSFSSDLLLM